MPTGFVLLLLVAVIAPIAAQFAGLKAMKITVGCLSVVPASTMLLSIIAYGVQKGCFRNAVTASEFNACEGAGDFLVIVSGVVGAMTLTALAAGALLAVLILKLRNNERRMGDFTHL